MANAVLKEGPWMREAIFDWAARREAAAAERGWRISAYLLWHVAAATDRVNDCDPLDVKARIQWEHRLVSKAWVAWSALWSGWATYAIDQMAYHANWQSDLSVLLHALAVLSCLVLAGLCLWMICMVPRYSRDEDYMAQLGMTLRRHDMGRKRAEEARHAETRQMQQMVLDWWEAHKDDPGMTKDKAAEQMAETLVPLKFRTVRDYLKGV